MAIKFTHLHVHSHYSLLDGLSKIDDIVNRCRETGMDSVALTDHGNLYGAIEFYQKTRRAGIKPIIGCELYIAAGNMRDKNPGVDDKRFHLTVLAENETGYKNLIQLVSKAHLEGFYYKPRVDKELLQKHAAGLIALSGCQAGEISRALSLKKLDAAEELTRAYQDIFGKNNFYLEIQKHPNLEGHETINQGLRALSQKIGSPLVATTDSHYITAQDAEAQDILVSVQTGGGRLEDEDRFTMRSANLSLRAPHEMEEMFSDLPEALARTQEISDRVSLELVLGKNVLPHFIVPPEYDADSYLQELALRGLEKRYGIQNREPEAASRQPITDRFSYELSVIRETGFASYFLIVQDLVNWAREHGIVVGPGRGSAAGSLVSYALGITNIDPLRYNLLFERFLNPERISMPDIDLDFADTRRDEVLEYVAKKYGRDRVAQIITFGTMAARAAIRDVGRAIGMPYSFCDQIAKMIPFSPQGEKTGWLKKSLQAVQEFKDIYARDPEAKRLIDSAIKLEGVARHASTHACGVVIAPRPLMEYLPLQHAVKRTERNRSDTKKEERNAPEKAIVTQYEMHAVEDLGLLKMDFLGLRNLTIIENTLKLAKRIHGIEIDIDKISLDDRGVYELFQRGETTGLFQFESSGMRRYLKELKPTELEDLIAMVALYRPGPMELIPSYIRRKHGQENISYIHPKLEPILRNTYGIGVYQEQMMQIARDLGGYTLPEADTLRKAIGKKVKSLLDEQRHKLTSGMIKNGLHEKIAEQIWELFPPFARYGFNRSHAACYALIAYQTGWLKAHYPTEFMTALLAAESTDIEKTAFFVEETRAMGIEILPPDVNESFASFTVVAPKKIRFGLGAVKNVGSNIVDALIEERGRRGKFETLIGFAERVRHKDFNKKSLEALIKCGALDALGERGRLLANLETLLEYNRESQRVQAAGQGGLFDTAPDVALTSFALKPADQAPKRERLQWEKELLGLYVTEHPLEEYKDQIKQHRATSIKHLSSPNFRNQSATIVGVVCAIQKVTTKSGQPMLFVKMEDLSGRTEVLVFPKTLAQNPGVWQTEKVLVIRGRVSDKDGVPKILCEDAVEIV